MDFYTADYANQKKLILLILNLLTYFRQ